LGGAATFVRLNEPLYCLITCFESGPEFEKWILENNPITEVDSDPIEPEYADEQRAEAVERRAARTEQYGYDPSRVYYGEA